MDGRGVVPLGYRVEDRALHIVEDHAEIVRSFFVRYLEAGSVVRLKQQLDAEGFRLPIRIDGAGRSTGGGLFSRGHVYKLLSNPIYVGRIAHEGQVHEGQHPPIVPQELWEQVQRGLRDHLGAARTKRTRQSSDALLAGKLYDDGGNRMSPTWARKGSKSWRYYGASLRSSHRSIARASIAGLGRSRHFRRPPALRNSAALVVLSGWFWSPLPSALLPRESSQHSREVFKARSTAKARSSERPEAILT